MKMREKNKIRSAVKFIITSAVLALTLTVASVAAFAEGENERTQTVYIGGNMLVVSATEGSYWYYNEADGSITESDEDNANIIINNEKQYDDEDEKDDGEMYMSIKNVNITSNGQNYYYFSNSGIYSLADELFLRVYGDCRISGAEYGIYANRIHLSGQDKQAKLTVTGDNTLAKPGTYFSQSEAMHLNYRSRIVSVSSLRTDFSVILRSTTNNTVYGTFTLFGSKNSIFAGADIDGADAKEFFADEDGYYQLGDKSQYKYIEYRVGIELYDKVEITDATLTFNAGDKPKFTAKLTEEDKFSIWEEEWALLDENGKKVKWCSSVDVLNPTDEENLLTEFEEGKTYYYSISIRIDDFFGEYADNVTVTINGKSYNFDNSGNNYYYTLYMTDFIEMTPAVKSDTVINKVEISGATLSYNDGDKPVATAVIGGEFKDNYEIAYEYWEEMQQNADGTLEPIAFWYSDENMYTAATKKFTKFESGKKYMYSIGLKAKDGYKFGSGNATIMTFDGKEVATPNYIPAFDGKTAMAISLKTINVTEVQQHIHSYGKWSYDNDNHWLQCTDSNCEDLSGSIKDKGKHVFDDDKDAVCDVCGYERQIVNPGDDNMPGQPDDKPTVPGEDNEPGQPDDKPTVPGDDNEPGQPDDKPTVPGDDNKPGQPDDKPTVPGDDNKPGQPDDKSTVPGDDNEPGQPDDKPTVPGDSNNEPEDPDDKPTVPGDDNKPENPDDNNPVTPGESEDVTPGECPGDPIVNPDTDGRLDIAIFAISVVSLAGAFAVRRKK